MTPPIYQVPDDPVLQDPAPAGGGEETATGSNAGTAGVGIFIDRLVDGTLRLKNIAPGEGIGITDDTGNLEVDVGLDVPALTAEASVDGAADYVPVYDASAGGHRKVLLNNLPAAGGGETNTASNQGTDGVGVYDTKVGVDLQFRNVAPASSKVTVALNGKDIDVDVDESQLTGVAGLVPIGAVVAWMKSLTGVPALPAAFVECNGQTLSDAGSPLNGQVIPDLNGGNRFLRGAATSGGTGGEATHTLTASESGVPAHGHTTADHSHSNLQHNHGITDPGHTHVENGPTSASGGAIGIANDTNASGSADSGLITASATTGVTVDNATISISNANVTVNNNTPAAAASAHNNEPQYTDVVWVMRVK